MKGEAGVFHSLCVGMCLKKGIVVINIEMQKNQGTIVLIIFLLNWETTTDIEKPSQDK